MIIKNSKIAVLVLTWNDWKNTIHCIRSLQNSNYQNFDTVLIDNNSNEYNFNQILKWLNKNNFFIVSIGFKYKNKIKNKKIK